MSRWSKNIIKRGGRLKAAYFERKTQRSSSRQSIQANLIVGRLRTKREEDNVHFQGSLEFWWLFEDWTDVKIKFFNFLRFFYHCSSSLLIVGRLRTKREENNVHFQGSLEFWWLFEDWTDVKIKFFNFSRFFYHCSSSLLIVGRLRTKREKDNVHFQGSLEFLMAVWRLNWRKD